MDHKINTISQIKILNWNANGIKKQLNLLKCFLTRHSIDIACISETHLGHSEKLKISGYRIYRTDRNANIASGGVAIIIKHKIIHHECQPPNTMNLETVGIRIKAQDGTSVNIICAYKHRPNTID
uniref:Endonuclease/exonuclease/phosphatase domain-containing protein n=1 Tax=Photinus pyralis TaxID=7054 RepID=A0A1Y1LWU6_PHOPY